MAFFNSNEQNHLLLYLGGGSVHGLSQMEVLIFLEELTDTPIAWMFDTIAGDSFGSVPASGLNIPKERGSKHPQYSAAQVSKVAERVLLRTFNPYRENYHEDMVMLEIKIKAIEKVLENREALENKDNTARESIIDTLAEKTMNYASEKNLPDWLRKKVNKQIVKNVFTGFSNLITPKLESNLLPVLEVELEKLKAEARDIFFSFDHVHESLKRHLAYPDGSPVKLMETITGFHSEAFNISAMMPATHSNIPAIENWDGHCSDPDLTLTECCERSMTPQTYIKPHKSEFSGDYYDDIAHHSTMASPMNALRRKFAKAKESGALSKKLNLKGLSIGVGTIVPKIDPERMEELLILGRLDTSEGSPLIQGPVIYNTTKAIRDLEEEFGSDNIAFIEKILDPAIVKNKFRYRNQLEKFPEFSKELIRTNIEEEAKRLPAYNMIDARPETIEKIKESGWAMIWENLAELVEFAKLGLQRAHERGFIDEKTLSERMAYIDECFPDLKAHQHDKATNIVEYLRSGGPLRAFGLGAKNRLDDDPADLNDSSTPAAHLE